MRRRRPSLPVFLAASALFLVPWSPVALLCIWVAQRFATPAARERKTLATTHEQGVLQ